MLLGQIVQQLEVAWLQPKVHPDVVAQGQRVEHPQGFLLLLGQAGDVAVPLSQLVVRVCIAD